MRFPDIRAVVGRKTLKALKESTMNTIFSIMRNWGLEEEVHYHYNKVEGTITFWNDSVIIMKEMADLPSDPEFERFGSSEYTIAFLDEISEMSEKAVEVLFSRLRWNIPATFKVSKMLMSTNPTVNWVRDRFVQDEEGNRVECRPGEYYIPFRVDDNPDKEFVAHYKRSLQKIKDVATRERLLEGNWDFVDVNEAGFYNCFDGSKHLETRLKERVYDPNKPLILSFDFNVHPFMTCLVAQIDYEKQNVYFIEEILGYPKDKRNNTPGLSNFIFNKYKRAKHRDKFIITGDPAGLARSSQTKEGVNNYSIIRNELTGLNTAQKLLKVGPSQTLRGEWINGILGESLDGWDIYIDLRCRKLTSDLIYQLTNEDGSKDKSKVKDPKTGVKYEKHGHCFAAGTMVTTINGDVPIEDVQVGDLVLTRKGYKKVTFSGITATNAVVKDYSINGHVLPSTTDHPYYTEEDGFVEIDNIRSEKTFITNSVWKEKQLCTMEQNSIDTQDQKREAIDFISKDGFDKTMESSKKDIFTDMSGKVSMVKSLRGVTSTTSMKTQGITTSAILNASQQQSICQTMQPQQTQIQSKCEKRFLVKTDTKRLNGTGAMKAELGTENMQNNLFMGQKESLNVLNVEQPSQQQLSTLKQNTAHLNVESELQLGSLGLRKVKAKPIASNERIEAAVYDITVEDEHEFFANGILVHNCSDAFDYLLCLFLQKSWYKYKRGGNETSTPASASMPRTFEY